MGIKKGKTTYNKLLARMGCGDYKKWNTAFGPMSRFSTS